MSQLSFSDAEGQAKRKQTRREKFLAQMDELLPWKELWKSKGSESLISSDSSEHCGWNITSS